MVRGKRPTRGGKRKFNRHESRPKPKKRKFNFREASYVKEREANNQEIEKRRKMLEEERLQQEGLETDSSDNEQANPVQDLLSTFSNINNLRTTAIESASESDSADNADAVEERSDRDEDIDDLTDDEAQLSNCSDNEEIKIKEADEEDPETAQEDAGCLKDPFSIHLHDDLSDTLYKVVSNVPQITERQKIIRPTLGNLICEIPKPIEDINDTERKLKVSVLEDKQFAKCGTVPSLIDNRLE